MVYQVALNKAEFHANKERFATLMQSCITDIQEDQDSSIK